jgi:hypothetical protein
VVVDRMPPGYGRALDVWPALFRELAGRDWATIFSCDGALFCFGLLLRCDPPPKSSSANFWAVGHNLTIKGAYIVGRRAVG